MKHKPIEILMWANFVVYIWAILLGLLDTNPFGLIGTGALFFILGLASSS